MTLGRVVALAAMVCACKGTNEAARPPEPDAGSTIAGPDFATTCAGSLQPMGPACVPRLDDCDDRSTPRIGGGCRAVGVPDDGCADGFVREKNGECTPVLPKSPCAEGEIALPGDDTCKPIAACGAGKWGDLPDHPKILYVDAAHVGSDADGSIAKPFARIGDAIAKATDDPIIAIAEGRYVEDLVLDRPMRLYGRCPSRVIIEGKSGDPEQYIVEARAPSEVHRVAVVGRGRGAISTSSKVLIDEVWVHDVMGRGIGSRMGSAATIDVRRSLIERTQLVGIVAVGSAVTLDRVIVRTVNATDAGGYGVQIALGPEGRPATLSAKKTLIENVEGPGLDLVGADGTIEASVIRDGRERGGYGHAVVVRPWTSAGVKHVSNAILRQSLIERSVGVSIGVSAANVTLDRTTVRDGRVTSTGFGGYLVHAVSNVDGQASISIVDSVLARARGIAVQAEGATVTLTRSIVRDTAREGALGCGVCGFALGGLLDVKLVDTVLARNRGVGVALANGDLAITGSHLLENAELGVSIESGRARIFQSLVRDMRSSEIDGSRGACAIGTRWKDLEGKIRGPSELTIDESVLARCRNAGAAVFGSSLKLLRSHVLDTNVEEKAGIAGIGVIADMFTAVDTQPTVLVEGSFIEKSRGAAVALLGAEAEVRATLVRDSMPVLEFGDGVMMTATESTLAKHRGNLALRDVWIDHSTRAALSIFGSHARIEHVFMTCSAFDIDLEHSYGGLAARRNQTATLEDGGRNGCGCDASTSCRAQSSGLAPVPTK